MWLEGDGVPLSCTDRLSPLEWGQNGRARCWGLKHRAVQGKEAEGPERKGLPTEWRTQPWRLGTRKGHRLTQLGGGGETKASGAWGGVNC